MNSSARKGTTATALMSTKNFLELIPLDVDLETTRQLVLKGKNITAIPPNIGVLLREVRRLDLTENDIRDVAPLATLTNLTSVNLTKNQRLLSVAALAPLQLTVCVLAHCGLRSLAGLEGSAATLRTLIVNDNNLVLQSPHGCSVDGVEVEDLGIAVKNYEVIACLTGCETLVLSRNPLLCSLCVPPAAEGEGREGREEKPEAGSGPEREQDWTHPLSAITKMSSLKKLSLSDCGLTHLPRRWFVPMVTELRLSRNKLTTLVPEGVLFRSVKILDVSHNELEEASTLRRCRFVRHLSVCGNPFMESGKVSIGLKRKAGEGDGNLQDGEDDVPPTPARARGAVLRYLMRVMPHLEVLDSTPLARFMEGVTNEEQLEEEGKSVHTAKAKGQSGADVAGQQAVVEDEDHVLDPPDVSEPAKAPIVRREHTNLLATKKKKYAQGADVAEIMIKRKSEVSGW